MHTLARRIIGAVPVIIGISFLIFLLMHIAPGDPVSLLLGDNATPEDIARTRNEWGLDRPLMVQYWEFLSRAVRGDFGRSLKFNEPVMKLVWERLPATLELAFSTRFSSSMTSIVARAAVQVTGLPPNVEIVLPCMLSATSGVAIVAPMGTPLAMPLAKVMMSGSTPQCSMPNILPPVRPQPVCTSSQINKPPYFLMIPTISLTYSLGGVMKPPTP